MSRTTATARTSRRGVLVVVVAALVLAGCGSAKVVVGPHLTGSPSLSIDVPLQSVACTTSGACVAAGANGSTVAPSAVVQVSRANGVWTAPSIPSTVVTSISSSACWASQCLVGGTQLSGDALWLVSPATMTVTASMTPSAGKGVSALSCFAAASCAVVDTTGITGSARLSFTSDAGGTSALTLIAGPRQRGTVGLGGVAGSEHQRRGGFAWPNRRPAVRLSCA